MIVSPYPAMSMFTIDVTFVRSTDFAMKADP
jgi:hypothetical protein